MKVEIINTGNMNPKVYLDGVRLRRNFNLESSRALYFSKEYVVKLENDESFLNQCRSERQNWKKLKKKYGRFFAPTLHYGKQKGWEYVVQPRIGFKKLVVEERRFRFFNGYS